MLIIFPPLAHHRFGRSKLGKQRKTAFGLRFDDVCPVLSGFVRHTAAQRYITGVVYQHVNVSRSRFSTYGGTGSRAGRLVTSVSYRDGQIAQRLQFQKSPLIFFLVSPPNTAALAPPAHPGDSAADPTPFPPSSTATRSVKSNASFEFPIKIPGSGSPAVDAPQLHKVSRIPESRPMG